MTVHPETVKRGFHPDPEKSIYEIQHQTDLTWRYVEYQHWDPQWRIGGHTDGLICENRIKWIYENRKLYKADPLKAYRELAGCGLDQEMILFELKTAGNYVYDKIDNPDAIAEYYKMQANVYQAMTGIGKTMFWYMKRDDYTSKAFIYEYDQKWWDLAKRKAQIIWEAIRDESLPESMMLCKLPSDKRAKECAHGETCWMNARKLDWPKYVADGKARAEAEGRKLLDLSTWTAEPKDESLTT